jgi:glucuronate isomerase
MAPPASLEPHPARLLPPDPGVRAIARRLYEAIRALPHGHVDRRLLRADDSRAAVTDTVVFTRTSGFIDDTRAFCSIPARYDTLLDLVETCPREVLKL